MNNSCLLPSSPDTVFSKRLFIIKMNTGEKEDQPNNKSQSKQHRAEKEGQSSTEQQNPAAKQKEISLVGAHPFQIIFLPFFSGLEIKP